MPDRNPTVYNTLYKHLAGSFWVLAAESSASGPQSGKAPYHSLTLPHLFYLYISGFSLQCGGLMAFHKGVIIDSGRLEWALQFSKEIYQLVNYHSVCGGGGCFLDLEQNNGGVWGLVPVIFWLTLIYFVNFLKAKISCLHSALQRHNTENETNIHGWDLA